MEEELKRLVERLAAGEDVQQEMLGLFAAAANDPDAIDRLHGTLTGLIGEETEAPLDIGEHYHPGDGRPFELGWPLGLAATMLPVPFEQLDRETQFFVLFQEWSRREMEGMFALNGGDVDGAEQTFEECLQRADQLDVPELRARSHEGMTRVAQRRGDRAAEVAHAEKARAARA